jgi:hypothetical protein
VTEWDGLKCIIPLFDSMVDGDDWDDDGGEGVTWAELDDEDALVRLAGWMLRDSEEDDPDWIPPELRKRVQQPKAEPGVYLTMLVMRQNSSCSSRSLKRIY